MSRLLSPTSTKLLSDTVGGFLMGVGYTSGAYGGFGGWNTADPYGIHTQAKSYNKPQFIQVETGLSYGYYGRRRYRRFRRYRGYRNRRYYRRGYY